MNENVYLILLGVSGAITLVVLGMYLLSKSKLRKSELTLDNTNKEYSQYGRGLEELKVVFC